MVEDEGGTPVSATIIDVWLILRRNAPGPKRGMAKTHNQEINRESIVQILLYSILTRGDLLETSPAPWGTPRGFRDQSHGGGLARPRAKYYIAIKHVWEE